MSWRDRATPIEQTATAAPSGWRARAQVVEPEGDGQVTAAVRNFVQAATANLSDEVAGVGEAVGRAVGVRGLGGPMRDISLDSAGPTTDWEVLKDAYLRGRNKERESLKKDAKEYPKTARASNVVGAIASPANKVIGGMSLAKGGAVLGGASGLGASEADTVQGLALDAAIGAGAGAVLGKGIDKATPYVAAGGKYVADKVGGAAKKVGGAMKGKAEELAFKAQGAMLKDFRAAHAPGRVNEVGRYLLDRGAVKAFDSVDDVATKVGALKESAGKQLDEVYRAASEKFKSIVEKVGFDPKRDKSEIIAAAREELGDTVGAEAAIAKLSKYLDQVAKRHGDKPAEQAQRAYKKAIDDYMPKFRGFLRQKAEYQRAVGQAGDDLNQPVLSGMTDDLQRTQMAGRQTEVIGKPAQVMRPAPAEPMMTQSYLPDLPTGKTEAARLYGRPGDANFGELGGDAANRVGQRIQDALEGPAQTEFLNRNTAEQISMFGRQGEIAGTGIVPRSYVGTQRPVVVQGRGQTTMPIAPQPPTRPIRPVDVRNPMDPRRANDVKGALDDAINYARSPLSKEPAAEKAFSAARRVVSKKVDEAIDSLGGETELLKLKSANREYGLSATADRIAKDRIRRESANKQMFGLTDTITGVGALGYGASTQDWDTAIGIMAAKKLGEKYGASTLAAALDRGSKFLLRSPDMQKLAQTSPQAFRAAVIDLTSRIERKWGLPKAAQAPNELDRDSSVPARYEDRSKEYESKPPRGRNKWSADGFDKLMRHAPDIELDRAQLMQDPKTRELLIQASDLKPGTKAMDKIMMKIKDQSSKERK